MVLLGYPYGIKLSYPIFIIMKCKYITAVLILNSCSYRYGTGSFVVDNSTPETVNSSKEPNSFGTVAQQPQQPQQLQQVVTPCSESSVEKLEITNKLDSAHNTIVTTAVTTRSQDKTSPCNK